MIKCGKTGATLLYGTKCAGCDCQLARFHDGGVIPKGTVHMGFDLASGPDMTVHGRYGDRYEFRMEDIERASATMTREAEAHLRREAARRNRAMEEEFLRTYQRHSRTAWTMDDPGFRPGVEIITDPADRRGFDAKPIGGTRP